MSAPIPPDEAERLAALHSYRILGTPPEEAFDDLGRLAARLLGTPIALISFVDGRRQWFKASIGLDLQEVPCEESFCARVIMGQREPVIVPDTTADSRLRDDPLVAGPPGIRFYAGAPLLDAQDRFLGTLCVIDREPREERPGDREALQMLSRRVMSELELRRGLAERDRALESWTRAQEALAALVPSTARESGEGFVRTLVEQLSRLLGVSHVFVSRVVDAERSRARVLAMWAGGSLQEPFEYDLAGTPCERVIEGGLAAYPDRLQERFPEDPWLVEAGVQSYLATPLYSPGGDPLGTLGVMDQRPIENPDSFAPVLKAFAGRLASEMVRAEAESQMRESEERYRWLAEHSTDMISCHDPEGVYLYVSPACRTIMGYEPEELVGRFSYDFFHPDDVGAIRDSHDGILASPEPRTVRFRTRRKDGTYVWTECVSRLVRDAKGATRIIAASRDVSQQRQLEEQLRQAQKMEAVGQLAGGIAHDFNNALTVIQGYADMLVAGSTADPELAQGVREIKASALRASRLTRQLLAYSRKQILEPEVLSLNLVVDDTEEMLERLVAEQAAIEWLPGKGLGHVRVDRSQLEQVIVNLAVNARDAMPHGGRLTLATAAAKLGEGSSEAPDAPAGSYVKLSVSDQGTGMDEATRSRIFEPFFTTKKRGEGTGLGLAMVYGIVKQSNGFIYVDSKPGLGTTFRIYLPEVEEETSSAANLAPEVRQAGSGTILVVEDQAPIRTMIERYLRSSGFDVLVAASGQEAISLASGLRDIDLLLTDVVLTDSSGPRLATLLRESHPGMRVLLMSGYPGDEVARHGAVPGAELLEKPFRLGALAEKIRMLLSRSSGDRVRAE